LIQKLPLTKHVMMYMNALEVAPWCSLPSICWFFAISNATNQQCGNQRERVTNSGGLEIIDELFVGIHQGKQALKDT
jgi:hypothetical protein